MPHRASTASSPSSKRKASTPKQPARWRRRPPRRPATESAPPPQISTSATRREKRRSRRRSSSPTPSPAAASDSTSWQPAAAPAPARATNSSTRQQSPKPASTRSSCSRPSQILTTVFGYTRGEAAAGRSTLRPFRATDGSIRLHAIKAETEGLLFRLDPLRVATLAQLPAATSRQLRPIPTRRVWRSSVSCEIPRAGEDPALDTPGADLLRLIHSLSHRIIRKISAFAGIERDALSEYLVPLHLGFVVFAASRGDFVLGGLQALFENDLDKALREVVHGEPRCALDPGCTRNGSACAVCLHVGEPSCRYYNQFLARTTLFGPDGYLTP